MAEEVRAMAAAHGRSSVSQSQTALPNLGVGRLRWPRLVPLALRRGLVRQLRRAAVRARLFRLLGHPGTDAALPEQLARVP